MPRPNIRFSFKYDTNAVGTAQYVVLPNNHSTWWLGESGGSYIAYSSECSLATPEKTALSAVISDFDLDWVHIGTWVTSTIITAIPTCSSNMGYKFKIGYTTTFTESRTKEIKIETYASSGIGLGTIVNKMEKALTVGTLSNYYETVSLDYPYNTYMENKYLNFKVSVRCYPTNPH